MITLSLHSTLNVTEQISQAYTRTSTREIMVLLILNFIYFDKKKTGRKKFLAERLAWNLEV